MKKKIVIIIFIIAMCPIILCGCWNYSEIDTLAIVAGVAIDKDISTNKYIVTTEVITTQRQGGSSTIGSELYSSEGDSIFNAVRNMIKKTGLKLFWSAEKVLIISEPVANEGVIPVIDWAHRDSSLRSDMWILIAKGDSAAEILKTKVNLNNVTSFHLNDAMTSWETLSKFPNSMLWLFVDAMSSEGKSEAIATVKNELNAGTIVPNLNGSAIFKSDKLVGYIDGDETLYMLMIQNKIKQGLITLKDVSGSGTSITLEIHENKTKLTPLYNNGISSLIIDIYPVVTISEVGGTKDFIKEENLKILKSEAEKKIEDNIQSLISKLQKNYHSDVLGFGEIFKKEKPKVSETYKNNGEDILIGLKTEVNVHLKIKGSGTTTNPISIEK
ncbi:Ger(x)C family spore germination protein [Clostridium sp. CM028]|uniref:Ger(x)C family spore germination protein n=1 Tax=unclassified Clostridium TaxID=2614128 RepID=UPI001C0BCD67|nr:MULTISPECIES: Ger(x)C family spore germination protein [unclassified Clostridium]MBU3091793.1 Ger(x)C family spore germination protein [Clostridium sp. CF011]MBW9145421.1 Ger(x)C family spore germination protein [Clostridium sp. CM027]MBW9148761.1 Ger(x)C family spore germination protein [Clostridium sp. CM028]UVE39401.1 Ger(x)C family spore germination protein [Clostridium sp. CM027]WAG68306.1 Ger(x)C family spore germination protein [Clostridium sp. CF011]